MSRRPDYERDGVRLYLGDCLEILPQLDPVDVVVTDPPWGIDVPGYESHDDSGEAYARTLDGVFAAHERLADGGFIAVYQSSKRARQWARDFPCEWQLIALPKTFVQAGGGDIVAATDYVLWWRRGEGPTARQWQKHFARDWHICDSAPATRDPLSKQHPCPRPLEGVVYLVLCFAPPGATVLDAYMGSGTTGVACVRTGRKFVGIEIEPKYFDIAVRRIDAELRQGRFDFAAAAEGGADA